MDKNEGGGDGSGDAVGDVPAVSGLSDATDANDVTVAGGSGDATAASDGAGSRALKAASPKPPAAEQPRIRLIVGLGNPGEEYAETRHNAGFMAIDALAEQLGASYWKSAGGAMAAECSFAGEKLVLAKPQRFMNLSGQPVKGLLKTYNLKVGELLVIHDELDLPEGVLRLKQGGGSAGHKGLRSITESVGESYARLRIGIGRPPGQMPAERYVLQKLGAEATEELKVSAAQAADIALDVVKRGVLLAMNDVNQR